MKLKLLTIHNVENVPDHLLQEMQEFAMLLTRGMQLYVDGVPPNIALSGINWAQACMIKHLVTNDPQELRKAAAMSCQMLLKNMEILIEQMEKENG